MNIPGWGTRKITVIGVVRDYHFESLKEKIKPQLFIMEPHLPLGRFVIRLNPNNVPATLSGIEKAYHRLMPNHPFQYSFEEDLNRRNYEKELKWKQIIEIGGLLTIFISCIGLFGFALLATEKRFKEIGIRKVLGASTSRVAKLICLDFLKLVFISFLIAIPIGWYAIHNWLQNFAYRINISWWGFVLSGILTLTIALLTVGFLAIKASLTNPIKSLKTE